MQGPLVPYSYVSPGNVCHSLVLHYLYTETAECTCHPAWQEDLWLALTNACYT